jgi:hypothetical protein
MPRQICTGCGLTTDANGNLIVNTGDAVWDYPCSDTLGGRIYCGSDGILRADPQPLATIISLEKSDFAVDGTALDTNLTEYAALTFDAVNPSSCLPAVVFYTAEVEVSVDLATGARYRVYINNNRYVDYTNAGATSATNVGWQISSSTAFTLGEGATSSQSIKVTVDKIGSGTATLRRIEIRVRGSIMALRGP